MDQPAFERQAAALLERLFDRIDDALGDELDVDYEAGILTLKLADGRTYLLNKHAPNREIWLSSPLSGAWHFAPPEVTMRVGQMLVATNRGGEAHTFTEVEEFGGGIVPLLNQLTGLTTVAPECGRLTGSDFIAPGASTSETEEDAGVEKYQCCIHPWMRAEVRIAPK